MKSVPKKNYITYFIIVVLSILFVLYLNSWYKAYKEEELKNSYISKYITEISYNEFNNYVKENPNFIVYIGKKNCEECIPFEKDLYKIIKKNNLKDNFVFLNITNDIDKFNKDYNQNLTVLPNLAIINNNKIIDIISADKNTLVKSDLAVQILETNGIINND